MSVESFEPIPIDNMGGLVSLVDGADVPLGCSPDCRDVQFATGQVKTRPGYEAIHQTTAGLGIPYLKTFVTPDLVSRLLFWDTSGAMYKETAPGVKVLVSSGFNTNSVFSSVTLFGREWIAESDGVKGRGLPSVYDDSNLYLVGNQPPASNPTAQDLGTVEPNPAVAPTVALAGAGAGQLSNGVYSYKVLLVTGDGTTATTQCGPASSNVTVVDKTTDGKVKLTAIPTGTVGVVIKRRIYRTLVGGATYYYIGYVNDNVTTEWIDNVPDASVDITKTEPVANTSGNGQIVAGERQAVVYFENSAGALSKPSPAVGWTAAGGLKVRMTGIPIWPNVTGECPVVKRHLAFTASGGATFYHVAGKMTIGDNTTNALDLDFSEAELLAGEDISALFRQQVPAANTDFQGQLGVGAYSQRLCWWGGNPATGQPFRGSLVRWSEADDPEFYDNLYGLMNVSENDGQAIKAGFELNNRFHFVKQASTHSTEDDGVNPPSKWALRQESPTVGTPSVHGVGLGEDWVVIANRSGLYYFAGGAFIKISQEIQPTWDTINWQYGHLIWVQVDTQRKRIYIGAPFCTGTTPNLLLVLDYQEGILNDPLANGGSGRKWSPWFIKAYYMAFIKRADLDDKALIGSNDGTGYVHMLSNAKTDDNGAAINSYYKTAFVSRPELGRQLFGYATATVRGAGSLTFATVIQGGAVTNWNPVVMANPATKDMEKMIDVQNERCSFRFGTNAVGAWYSVVKFCAWSKEHPFAKHRGTNV